MVTYFYKFITGEFVSGMIAEEAGNVFANLLSDPVQMAFWMILIVVAGFLVCSQGLQNGLEKISKGMMSALLVLIIVLAVHSFVLPGAGEGVKFYLIPSIDTVRDVGFGSVIAAAMNQAFFTLSLGVAAMEIFGSLYEQGFYTGRRRCAYLCAGYLCSDYVRSDYFPCMFQLWSRGRCGSKPYLYHIT